MSQVVHFQTSGRIFERYGQDTKKASISRLTGTQQHHRCRHCALRQLLHGLDGSLGRADRNARRQVPAVDGGAGFRDRAGHGLWVPRGTALAEGEGAAVFYALHQVDWRTHEIRTGDV